MKTLPLVLLAPLAFGCTPPTHNAVSGLGDCIEPPPGVDAPLPRHCLDAPSHDESGAWADCVAAAFDGRPNEPCTFGGGYCGAGTGWTLSVTASCVDGRLVRYAETTSVPPPECTETGTEVVGSCLVLGCVSLCPGEPVPPTSSSTTWDVDDETSCRALLDTLPEAGEPCSGDGWCQGLHIYADPMDPGHEISEPIVAFCGDDGLALLRRNEVPGRPYYAPK